VILHHQTTHPHLLGKPRQIVGVDRSVYTVWTLILFSDCGFSSGIGTWPQSDKTVSQDRAATGKSLFCREEQCRVRS
jgi:hypothetical protein